MNKQFLLVRHDEANHAEFRHQQFDTLEKAQAQMREEFFGALKDSSTRALTNDELDAALVEHSDDTWAHLDYDCGFEYELYWEIIEVVVQPSRKTLLMCVNDEREVVSAKIYDTHDEAMAALKKEYDAELSDMHDSGYSDDDIEQDAPADGYNHASLSVLSHGYYWTVMDVADPK